MNVGQIFETHLGWASRGLGRQIEEMLDGMHERGRDVAGKDAKAIRTKLKDVYGDGYAKDIDARDDEAVVELASNLVAGVPMGTPVFDGARESDVSAMQEALIAPDSAEELRAAEKARSVRDDTAGTGPDPLSEVVPSGHGTDADAGDYLTE